MSMNMPNRGPSLRTCFTGFTCLLAGLISLGLIPALTTNVYAEGGLTLKNPLIMGSLKQVKDFRIHNRLRRSFLFATLLKVQSKLHLEEL